MVYSTYEIKNLLFEWNKKWNNLCREIKCCLGISSQGNVNKFLNQKGEWIEVATAAGSVVNTIVNTLSNVTTANRSLRIAASGGDITGGIITVKIEFIV